jgi:histidine ammonia-lyase
VFEMTQIRQDAIKLLEQIPEDKIIFIIQIMQGLKGLDTDEDMRQREEAFLHLEKMRKKVPDLDYDRELAEYREEKYGLANIG